MTDEHLAEIQTAREQGMLLQKEYLIKQAEMWCNRPVDSAALHPDQKVTQGQIRPANYLLEFLKK